MCFFESCYAYLLLCLNVQFARLFIYDISCAMRGKREDCSMTNKERNKRIITAIREATARALVSREAARDALIKEGIYTKRGELRVRYGGVRKKTEATA